MTQLKNRKWALWTFAAGLAVASASARAIEINSVSSPSWVNGQGAVLDTYGNLAAAVRAACPGKKGVATINWINMSIHTGSEGMRRCGKITLDPALDKSGNDALLLCYPQLEVTGDVTCPDA